MMPYEIFLFVFYLFIYLFLPSLEIQLPSPEQIDTIVCLLGK